MKKTLNAIGGIIAVVIFIAIGILQTGEVSPSMPNHAIVYVDEQLKIYHSPRHFIDDKIQKSEQLKSMTAGEAKDLKYVPDPDCKYRDYFSYTQGSVLYVWLMSATGQKLPERWNADGTWNW